MNCSEVKARREKFSIELRKSDNESLFTHRRKRMLPRWGGGPEAAAGEKLMSSEAQLAEFVEFAKQLESEVAAGNLAEAKEVLGRLRTILSAHSDPFFSPLPEFVRSGLPALLMRTQGLPGFGGDRRVVEETAWIFANLCSVGAEHLGELVALGLLEFLDRTVRSDQPELMDHALWGISNLLGDSLAFREEFERLGTWRVVFEVAERNRHHPKLARTAAWLFSNAMRSPPCPTPEQVS